MPIYGIEMVSLGCNDLLSTQQNEVLQIQETGGSRGFPCQYGISADIPVNTSPNFLSTMKQT